MAIQHWISVVDDCETEDPVDRLPTPVMMSDPEQAVEGIAGHVVGEAVWAPSVHNTQPWWFSVDRGGLCLYADPARQLAAGDADGRAKIRQAPAARRRSPPG